MEHTAAHFPSVSFNFGFSDSFNFDFDFGFGFDFDLDLGFGFGFSASSSASAVGCWLPKTDSLWVDRSAFLVPRSPFRRFVAGVPRSGAGVPWSTHHATPPAAPPLLPAKTAAPPLEAGSCQLAFQAKGPSRSELELRQIPQ